MEFDFIKYQELCAVFGCKKVSILCDILEANGISYMLDSSKRPMCLREAVNERLRNGSVTPTHPTP